MIVIIIGLLANSRGIFSTNMQIDKIIIDKASEINNYINKDDEILVLGTSSYYYLLFDKQPEFKYFFQYPIIKYNEKIREEIEKYIINERPKVIINEEYRKFDIYGHQTDEQIYGNKILEEITKNYEEYDIGVIKYYVLKEE